MSELTDEEFEVLSEYVEEVGSRYSVTKSCDGSTYSSTFEVIIKTKVPKGGDFQAVMNFNRIQSVNNVRNFFDNNRLKKA